METIEAPRLTPIAQTDDDEEEFDPFAGEEEDSTPETEGDDRVHEGEGESDA